MQKKSRFCVNTTKLEISTVEQIQNVFENGVLFSLDFQQTSKARFEKHSENSTS